MGDFVIINEKSEGLLKQLKLWNCKIEVRGLKGNMEKTRVMICYAKLNSTEV